MPTDHGPVSHRGDHAAYEAKEPRDLMAAIRLNRNGDDQALGDLAALQTALGDDDATRIIAQCAYVLGYQTAAEGHEPTLKPGALAWIVIAELTGDWLEAFTRAAEQRLGRGDGQV
jgi:hypothetical protein